MSNGLTRAEDWPERLHAALEDARHFAVSWGVHDCAMFASRCVEAMTGVDLAAPFRGRYASEADAAAILAEHGGVEGLAAYLMAEAGCEEIAPKLARRGDVVVIETARGDAFGVVAGVHVAVASEDGVAFLRASRARRAWRIG